MYKINNKTSLVIKEVIHSGVRSVFKYGKGYGDAEPAFVEEDILKRLYHYLL